MLPGQVGRGHSILGADGKGLSRLMKHPLGLQTNQATGHGDKRQPVSWSCPPLLCNITVSPQVGSAKGMAGNRGQAREACPFEPWGQREEGEMPSGPWRRRGGVRLR